LQQIIAAGLVPITEPENVVAAARQGLGIK